MDYKMILKRKSVTLFAIGFVFVCVMAAAFLGRDADAAQTNAANKIQVVATTTMLYDLAHTIGGERAEVTALMGAGVDPHLYQASAGDVTKLQKADVVLYNGLHLEGKMGDIFAALSEQSHSVICAEDGVSPSKLLENEIYSEVYDPHIWFDVSIWKDVAAYVAASLGEIDPSGAAIYAANLDAYLQELDALEAYIHARVAQIPKQQRILITAHDAFAYFGKAYGFEVKGLQGISTDAEAGTADVSELASFIAAHQIKAIFVESSVAPKNIEALQAAVKAQGFEVQIGGELFSDSLGDAESGCATYILTVQKNIDTIALALQ